MSEHVFAWVAGFGWTLMPYAPFRFERVSEQPKSIRVEHTSPLGTRRVVIVVAEDGQTVRSEPAHQDGPRLAVVELIEGAAYSNWDHAAAFDHWRVETSVLSVRWPEGFAVRSVAHAPPAFELVGPEAALIWVQGPFANGSLPPLEQMVGPGQTIERTVATAGGPLIELRYIHDGTAWHMFHCIVSRYAGADCVVTGQTPASGRDMVRAAVIEVAASLTPNPLV
jgi:hypothetical protein